MILRHLLLPVALVAVLGLVATTAQAAPVSTLAPLPDLAYGGRVHVGVGVAFPIGPAPRRVRAVHRAPGHWVVRQERVWVPGEVIGYDPYGYPIVTEGYWTVRSTRVWVSEVRYVPRPRPRGYVAVGLGFH